MRHLTAFIIFLICAVLFSCTGGGGGGGVPVHDVMPVLVDKTLPTIISTSPTDKGVLADAGISAKFSEEMDASSITIDTFILTNGETKVPGSVGYNAAIAVFTPSTDLLPGTSYVAVITTGVKDVSGNALEKEFTWTFSTVVVPDTTIPDTTEPDTTATGTPAVDIATTDTLATDATAPDTTVPDTTVPATTAPDVTLPTIPSVPSLITNAPSARYYHTAIWTGTEMIVWGGCGNDGYGLSSGGRYNPVTNTWAPISTINAPSARYAHAAVWTGTEMIVWGGGDYTGSNNALKGGAKYNPVADTWTTISTTNAPSARYAHTAIWTGTEMIVWGGSGGFGTTNTGGRYDPATDIWKPISVTNVPLYRYFHTAVWTGTEMIVWGGYGSGYIAGSSYLSSGGKYNPMTNTWKATSTTDAPLARMKHTAIWTGTEMIVWGGSNANGDLSWGAKYNPATDTWTLISTNAPSARYWHTAIWTGTEMIVWGGLNYTRTGGSGLDSGGRYDPATNTWIATSITDAPSVRSLHTAIWTGTEMIVWGGSGRGHQLNSGGKYNPAANTWMATFVENIP